MNVIVKHHRISQHTGEVQRYLTSLTESDVRETARGPFYAPTSEERNLQPSSSSHRANTPYGQAKPRGNSCCRAPDSRTGKMLLRANPPLGQATSGGNSCYHFKKQLPLHKGKRLPRIYLRTGGSPHPAPSYTGMPSLSTTMCLNVSQVAEGTMPKISDDLSRIYNQAFTGEVLPPQIHPSELSEPRQVHLSLQTCLQTAHILSPLQDRKSVV